MKKEILNRKEKERLFRRAAIIDAAVGIFAKKGYRDTTLDEIAITSEFGKGTIYNYFKSKEDLLEGVLRDGLNQFSEIFTKGNSVLLSEVDFEVAVRANFEMLQSNKMFWKLYYNLVRQLKVQAQFTK